VVSREGRGAGAPRCRPFAPHASSRAPPPSPSSPLPGPVRGHQPGGHPRQARDDHAQGHPAGAPDPRRALVSAHACALGATKPVLQHHLGEGSREHGTKERTGSLRWPMEHVPRSREEGGGGGLSGLNQAHETGRDWAWARSHCPRAGARTACVHPPAAGLPRPPPPRPPSPPLRPSPGPNPGPGPATPLSQNCSLPSDGKQWRSTCALRRLRLRRVQHVRRAAAWAGRLRRRCTRSPALPSRGWPATVTEPAHREWVVKARVRGGFGRAARGGQLGRGAGRATMTHWAGGGEGAGEGRERGRGEGGGESFTNGGGGGGGRNRGKVQSGGDGVGDSVCVCVCGSYRQGHVARAGHAGRVARARHAGAPEGAHVNRGRRPRWSARVPLNSSACSCSSDSIRNWRRLWARAKRGAGERGAGKEGGGVCVCVGDTAGPPIPRHHQPASHVGHIGVVDVVALGASLRKVGPDEVALVGYSKPDCNTLLPIRNE
jgi:hypothetical protein